MNFNDIIKKYQNGEPVVVGIVGNSVGEGYYANNYSQINTNRKANNQLIDPLMTGMTVGGWAYQLRNYLKAKNSSSMVINLSGSGWETLDHLGQGYYGSQEGLNSVTQLANWDPKPDIVFLPLGINDYLSYLGLFGFKGYSATFNEFKARYRILVEQILSNGMVPVLVKENPITDGNLVEYENYINEVGVVGSEYDLFVIDGYTPILANPNWRTELLQDTRHLNQTGHDIEFIPDKNFFESVFAYSFVSNYQTSIPGEFAIEETELESGEDNSYGYRANRPGTTELLNFATVLGSMTTGETKTESFDIVNIGNIAGVFNLTGSNGFSQSIPVEPGAHPTVDWNLVFSQVGTQSETLTVEFVTDQGTLTDIYTAIATVEPPVGGTLTATTTTSLTARTRKTGQASVNASASIACSATVSNVISLSLQGTAQASLSGLVRKLGAGSAIAQATALIDPAPAKTGGGSINARATATLGAVVKRFGQGSLQGVVTTRINVTSGLGPSAYIIKGPKRNLTIRKVN